MTTIIMQEYKKLLTTDDTLSGRVDSKLRQVGLSFYFYLIYFINRADWIRVLKKKKSILVSGRVNSSLTVKWSRNCKLRVVMMMVIIIFIFTNKNKKNYS